LRACNAQRLAERLAEPLDIRFGSVVQTITWGIDGVQVGAQCSPQVHLQRRVLSAHV
jgi:hypothetical protein